MALRPFTSFDELRTNADSEWQALPEEELFCDFLQQSFTLAVNLVDLLDQMRQDQTMETLQLRRQLFRE